MSEGGVDVSVLVPVLNEAQHLREAARAMLAQDFDGTVEFLFVDGGSDDASPAILAELAQSDPRVKVLANPYRRTPHALNIGLRAARGEFVARMDAHTIYPPSYLKVGVERLRPGDVASVSGPQLAVGVDRGSRRIALALRTSLGSGGARFRREMTAEVEVDTGFTGLWRRSTLLANGGWDEEWLNDQDVELAARLRKKGGRIVCVPEMAAEYIPRGALRDLARQYLIYGRYRAKTARRHPESMRRSQILPVGAAMAVTAAVLAPRPARRIARLGVATHGLTLLAMSARVVARGEGTDAAMLPGIWATMHLSYGFGFLAGCVRYGVPTAAISGLVRLPARRENPSLSPPKRMRLGVYTDYTYRRSGGHVYAERAFGLFLGRLAEELERVVIAGRVDPSPGAIRYALPDATRFVDLPYYRSLGHPGGALGAMARSLVVFWRLLDDVDGVWLLGPHPLGLAFAGLAAVRRKSVTLGVRQDFPRYVRARSPDRPWLHIAADLLEASWRGLGRLVPVIVVGPALAHEYRRGSVLELTVSLVQADDIAPPSLVAARSYEDGELRVLSVGRLEEEKNPLLLADVIAGLRQRDAAWRLTVCGEGPLEPALRQRLAELGVTEHVELRGYVPYGPELREIYRSSHALLHVSWTEGVPQVLFEAFAARLPVVATAVGGVAAAADAAAILIEPGNPDAAVQALERVRDDETLRAELIDAGARCVAGRTLDAQVRRVASFLSSRR